LAGRDLRAAVLGGATGHETRPRPRRRRCRRHLPARLHQPAGLAGPVSLRRQRGALAVGALAPGCLAGLSAGEPGFRGDHAAGRAVAGRALLLGARGRLHADRHRREPARHGRTRMRAGANDLASARGLFWAVFALTLALKLALATVFPFSGDEAFFFQWGAQPAWHYSDHPPLVGWLLALLHGISDAPLVLRSVTLVVTSVIALLVVDLLRRLLPDAREAQAWLAGAVYLAMPWSWMFVLVTTDTPLILFMALSFW